MTANFLDLNKFPEYLTTRNFSSKLICQRNTGI